MVEGPVAPADEFASVAGPWLDDDELASRPDFDAWLDGLIAADPEAARDPAVIVANGETAPITPGLIVELAAVDPQSEAGAFAWAEVGAALRLGDGEATGLVHAARALSGRLGT